MAGRESALRAGTPVGANVSLSIDLFSCRLAKKLKIFLLLFFVPRNSFYFVRTHA